MQAPELRAVFQVWANCGFIDWHNYISCFGLFSFPNKHLYFWIAAMHWDDVFMQMSICHNPKLSLLSGNRQLRLHIFMNKAKNTLAHVYDFTFIYTKFPMPFY